MALSDGNLSASDVALLTDNNRNNGFGFGGDGAWWIILFLIFGAFGFGNGGNGWFGNGSGSGILNNYALNSDAASLSRQIDSGFRGVDMKEDSIQQQLCMMADSNASQFSNLNTNILTQGAGLNNTLATNFAGVNQGISNNRYETQLAVGNAQNGILNSINALSAQQAQCCCDQRVLALQNANALQTQLSDMNYNNAMLNNGLQTSLAGINYNMATNTNALQNTLSNGFCTENYNNATNTRDIIDAINATARNTQDMLANMRLEDKNAQIADLQTQLNNANLRASQARQTNEIVDALRVPTPIPSFNVPAPWYNNNSCGCGCGNNF